MHRLTTGDPALDHAQIEFFRQQGYLVCRGLFQPDEVDALRQRFERLADGSEPAPAPGNWEGDRTATDPLARHPRVMFPHRWDSLSLCWLLDPRVWDILRVILEDEPVATQSMFYFKPPGARGQALHQDNFYLQVEPRSCIAVWIAIDPSTPENGGLSVVPQTQDVAVACPETADESVSFTDHLVVPPAGKEPLPLALQPGDTLFFNGNVIHGSGPNHSTSQWRRSFICHYMPAASRCISKAYFPLLNSAGEEVPCDISTSGGPCGTEFETANYGA
ncbi:MAG: phytanoyl-CoA dioxygenase family protein [Verrucomicrobia bacterium]|nr:phytanoyl-CoA dioxygenase family protein [Verrucomicrobiota bacterium]